MSTPSCLTLLVFHHHSYDHHDDGGHDMLMLEAPATRRRHGAGGARPRSRPYQVLDHPAGLDAAHASSSSSSAAWLWNPRTGDKIALPDVEAEHDHGIPMGCKCLLTHRDAAHPECFVALFDYKQPTMWYCKVSDDGRRGWRRYTYDIGEYEVPAEDPPPPTKHKQVISSIAAVQGELFSIASYQDMCAITFPSAASDDSDPELLYFDVSLVDFPEGMCSGRTWLVESGDELFLVCVCFVGFDPGNIGAVVVYRMDFSTEAWCRVHDVGDVVFLLEDANMAAACPASPLGLKANQVYFMKNLMADDGDLWVFDIGLEIQETTQVHQHDDDLILYRKPFWILPP